jgi:UDP-N-acetylglucosamine transferase subunit ALG13
MSNGRPAAVFVTVGTHQQPFERLVRALDALEGYELVVQYGYAEPPRGVTHAVSFMSFPEMLDHFERADAVVTHAGVGSILCATNAGHVPIIVPRLKRYREHVDDHQVQLVRQLDRDGRVIVVEDVAALPEALRRVPPRRRRSERPPGPLHEAVRRAILAEPSPLH